jgi:hypothetical protein
MTTEAPPCVHHDKIEPPNGPISIGRCKKCHREREYENHKFSDYNSKPMKKPSIDDEQERIWDG